MKKIISLIFCLIMLSPVFAAVPPVPLPVRGSVTVNNEGISGLEVQVTNKNTGKIITSANVVSLKTEGGTFEFDMSEIGFELGDTIETKVCDGTGCIQSFVMNSYNDFPKELTFNIGQVTPTPTPTETVKPISNIGETTVSLIANYYQPIDTIISPSKLNKLIDSEIEFDDEKYDIHEEIKLKGEIQTSLSNSDFGTIPYLVIMEGGMEYKLIFDEVIPITEISEDEPLKINLFGEPVEIVKASSSQITLRQGTIYQDKKEGDKFEVEGKILEVLTVGEGYIRVNYDGESATIKEDETVSVGGIEIYCIGAYPDDTAADMADFRAGTDIEKVLVSGDDYDDDELWQWNINLPNSISLSNQNDYDELDEEVTPLKEGEKIILPGGIVIKFHDVTKPETTELNIQVDDNYLRIDGNKEDSFNFAGKEYDRVLLNANGIYDEDENFIVGDDVLIGESGTYLQVGSAIIGRLKIELDMSSIYYDGVSFNSKDDEYLDSFGIIFKDPEEAVTEKDNFIVIVPDERPEVTITVGDELVKTDSGGCAICTPCKDCPLTCPEVKECIPTTINNCVPTPCATPTPCETQVCEAWNTNSVIAIITGILAVIATIGGGMQFYKNKFGKGVFLHRHRGIVGYHDANIAHNNTLYRHKRWKDDPLGCLADVKKLESGVNLG